MLESLWAVRPSVTLLVDRGLLAREDLRACQVQQVDTERQRERDAHTHTHRWGLCSLSASPV